MIIDKTSMRNLLLISALLIAVAHFNLSSAAVKEVSYPKVELDVEPAYKPDSAFVSMRNAMAQAVAKRDEDALFALVNRTFIWTQEGQLADDFDLGRDALHNFKVVFGFRAPGKDADGGVENGPFWDMLRAFAADGTYSESGNTGNLVCGPAAAEVIDKAVFEQARKKVEAIYDEAEWYFPLTKTDVTKSPNDTAPPIVKIDSVALPVLNAYPATEGNNPTPATHLQVLLPSGQSGWVPVSAVRPLVTGRLCYAKTPNSNWRIAVYDEGEG